MKSNHIRKKWEVCLRTQKELIDQLLVNRNIDLVDRDIFISPDFKRDLINPYLLTNMTKVVRRILVAKEQKEKIGIFSDYDCDGVISAKLFKNLFDKLNLETTFYFPNRESGYGLNKEGLDFLRNSGSNLIIASDLGITGKKEVEYAKNNNLELIIFDHHLIQKKHLPDCLIINPKQEDDKYPYKNLSAGGVIYKFLWALHLALPSVVTESFCKWNTDLAAISTIADIMPLTGENRLIVKYGIITLTNTKNYGLKELLKAAVINLDKLTPGVIGFQIAPRLNAPGRIKDANLSFELLNANPGKAVKIALEVNKLNDERRSETDRILHEARTKIIREKKSNSKVIVLSGKNWAPGLVGLVAGKLMEELSRPVIVLSKSEKISRGSARSLEKFHLLDAFEQVEKYLISFGGHARAGGLTLDNKHLDAVYTLLNEYAENILSENDFVPILTIDGELLEDEINLNLYNSLTKLSPFGFGNPKPTFILRKQTVQNIRLLGKENQHLKIKFKKIEGIIFNYNIEEVIKNGDVVDIVFTLEKNEWNNNIRLELNIIDFKQSDDQEPVEKYIS